MIEIDQSKIVGIQTRLLEWFQTNGRSFPWRETQDPYKILLVEKLLQQTTVRADLIQAYRELLIAFPTDKVQIN
jgi:A/G-specific adenine glycosylase